MSTEPAGHNIDVDDPRLEVKVATLAGQVALLAQSTSMSTQHMASSMSSMQADLREVSKIVTEIKTEQHEVRSHSEGLERLDKSITKLDERWSKAFADHVTENNKTSDTVKNWTGGLKLVGAVFVIISGLAAAYLTERFNSVKGDVDKVERRVERLEGLK